MYEINPENIIKAQQGNKEILEEIIKTNSGLVWSIVNRFLGRGYDKEELYQVGCIGFIKAINRFDTTLEFQLSTYAIPYIMGEIKKFIRDDGIIKISRSIKELSSKIKEVQREFLIKGEEITVEKLSKILKVSKEDISIAIESQNSVASIDEEAYEQDSQGESKISKINIKEDETNKLINKLCIEQLISKLEKREQKIILLRYYKGKTQGEVAKILNISQVQVSRIEKKILMSMRYEFNNVG